MSRRGDFSKKSTAYKFYKKGYSSSKPKYITAGQDLLIESDISGQQSGNAYASAGYDKSNAGIYISGNGDPDTGLSADVTVRTDSARTFDLKGVVAQFNHFSFATNWANVSEYSVYLFDYRVKRDVTGNKISLYFQNVLLSSVTMSTAYDWIRLRESAGIVYIERSADGSTWNSWENRAVQASDAMVSILKVTAHLGAGGNGMASVQINNIDISDISNNLLAIESKKVLNDLNFTKNINTPAASTALEMDYSPKDLPDSKFTIERFVNLWANPSFETSGPEVEVRRNLSVLPKPRSSSDVGSTYANQWSFDGTGTVGYNSGAMTITNMGNTISAGNIGGSDTTGGGAIGVGEIVTLSFKLTVVTGSVLVTPRIFRNGGQLVSSGPQQSYSVGEHIISITATTPPSTTKVWARPLLQGSSSTSLRLTEALIEKIGAPLPYFDGSMTRFEPNDLIPSWTGSSGNSVSILTGLSVPGSFSYNTATTSAVGFPKWLSSSSPHNGKYFMRGLVKFTGPSTVGTTGVQDIEDNALRTVSLMVRANRNITVQPRWQSITGGGGGAVPIGYEHTLTSSWSEIRRTGSSDKPNASVDMLVNDAQAGDIIDIDEHFTVLGEYKGVYFDGETSAMTGWNIDGTSYWDILPAKYEVENAHLLFGNTIEAIVSFKNNKTVTPEKKSILKFSGYIDAIDRDYNNDIISVTSISHGEILSNVIVGYADEDVESLIVSQTAQNTTESTNNRRQTFKPNISSKLSGVRVRLSQGSSGSAQVSIGKGSSIIASSKAMVWSGTLSAGVYDFELLSPVLLEAGQWYWLSVDGIVSWSYQNSNVFADGSRQQLSGGTWSNVTGDAYFQLYTKNPSVVFEYSGGIEGLVDRVFQETDSKYGLIKKGTVVNPPYNIGINAAVDNGRSILESALKMSPIGYWSSIDLGSGEYDLKPYPTATDHTLIFGRDFTEFNLSEAISSIVNDVPFIGGDIDSVQTKLAIRTNDRASIGAYKLGLSVESNGKVTRYDSAQLLSDYEIQNNNKPRQTTSIVIPASEYDIETFDTGQLVKILNANSEQLVKGLLIASVDYTPERAILSLDSAPQTITSSVDKLKRDLNNSETSGVSGVI